MPMDPEALYRQLGQLLAEQPTQLYDSAPLPAEVHQWIGRAAALVEEGGGGIMEPIAFNSCAENLGGITRHENGHRLIAILHRVLARAERNAPATAQGAFIPAGGAFNAYQAIGKVLQEATTGAFIVDPYMDASVLMDFASLAREGVTIRLLTDSHSTKTAVLQPAVARWGQEFGDKRKLFVRFTSPRVLHDRLILIDGTKVWAITQSLKDFANRSPASVVRVDGEMAAMKVEAYEIIWAKSSPMAS